MFLKVLILSVILIVFAMLILGIKLLFNKESSLSGHSCSLESGQLDANGGCAACGIQEVADCPEKKNKK